jgi:hypothetical protein
LFYCQGDRVGRHHRRHDRDAESRKRRELLRRVAELHLRHEEPGTNAIKPLFIFVIVALAKKTLMFNLFVPLLQIKTSYKLKHLFVESTISLV